VTGSGIATVARQEFRLRIRAGRWKWLLGSFFAVLLTFTALLDSSLGNLTDARAGKGAILYGGLMLFVLGLALLVVPALAAQSVNGDRERGTLATLQVTLLTPAEIVLGKFVAAWGTALVFLALTLPLTAYAMTRGGVPLGRLVVVTLVLVLLLGTVCAISLWLSSVLTRTTTSGVLAYLAVFALSVGTACIPGSGQQTFETTRVRTDRTWWLLAPNPFVVLADASPQRSDPDPARVPGISSDDLDPLGAIGRGVRDLRRPPGDSPGTAVLQPGPDVGGDEQAQPPVWPTGLAVNVALGGAALVLTTRRLRTPSRTLPRGQRVA
jgi:ABC-type transport system involved in cytochrome c biogenesis permease component